MKLWRWEDGRLNSGYRKLTLMLSTLLHMDAYVLHIPAGVGIPPHFDPVPGRRHFRLNVTLRGEIIMLTEWRNVFTNQYKVWRFGNRISYFRPDVLRHWAEPVSKDTYIFSIGWAIK